MGKKLGVSAETKTPTVKTVEMSRYDRTKNINVPVDQVERYKKSSWKVV